MDRIGFRKVERHVPNFRQWLAEKGEEDAGTELYFLSRLDRNAIHKLYDGRWSQRQARTDRKKFLSKSLQQIHAYHDAIERGDIEKVSEYVPLDLTKEADRAYNRVQQKRLARAAGVL